MTSLLDFQRAFHEALRGDAGALADMAARLTPGTAPRLSIHRATIAVGLEQTLLNAFPVVARIVGVAAFQALSQSYIAAHPPRHPLLALYGKDFPSYVAGQPIASGLPYLPDVARLEWARQDSFLAEDAPLLDAAGLDTSDAQALSALRLRVHPAARLISSPFPIYRIWSVNQPEVEDADIPAIDFNAAEHVVLTRPAGAVVARATSLADATLIEAVSGGATLGDAVEAAFAVAADFDVMHTLAAHFAHGTFRAV